MSSICLLVTVGSGARGPAASLAKGLVNALQRARPAHFLLLPGRSRDSLALAKQVLRGLEPATRAAFVPWSDEQAFLCLERPGQMESARAGVREAIREARRRFPEEVVVLHPQSGTRAAVAGAVLAAFDEAAALIEFSGGAREEEEEGGGPAAASFEPARWRAERDAEQAARCWDRGHFAAATESLHAAAAHLDAGHFLRRRLTGLALAAEGFAAKEGCHFAQAEQRLAEARGHWHLEQDAGPAALHELAKTCKAAAERCARCAKVQAGDRQPANARELLAETVDQSVRAGRHERYDEACSRLGRAMEMELQLRFAEATGGAFWGGRLAKGGKVPDGLRTPSLLAQLQRTELPREWSMEEIVQALHALGDRSVDELWQDLTDRRTPSEWRLAWAAPRGTVLGHGWLPADKAGLKGLRRAAGRFLGLQLAESHPLPPFDRRWLLEG